MAMKDKELAWWLVQNAGPVIRYRTLMEIIHTQSIELVSDALKRLRASPLVQKWLEQLIPRMGFPIRINKAAWAADIRIRIMIFARR